MTDIETPLFFLIIAGVGFFLLYLYAQYNSIKTWSDGQKRILEIEKKKFELERLRDRR